jgi:glucose dehydrogenase
MEKPMSSEKSYDVVIVGAGIAGALVAYKLAQAGKSVLILDGGAEIPDNRGAYMEKFYLSMAKTPESPYPNDADNPRPLTLDLNTWQETQTLIRGEWVTNPPTGYMIQKGPLPFSSTYERVAGGTTWHWMGTSLRLVPNDFHTQTTYGVGVDWPISYDDLEPYYCSAEQEIGVAADTANEGYLGITFGNDPKNPTQPYQYPMPQIPQSTLDQVLINGIGDELTFEGNPVTVYPTPQARNSIPYDERRVCAGNTNCIPICPIQAKYDATVTLAKAQNLGVEIRYKTIASSVSVDTETGLISGINYKQYADPNGPATGQGSVSGKLYILAAHAIETPKLLLNSVTDQLPNGVANRSDQVGRNLMDHPVQLSWALSAADQPMFPFRGPLSTSGVESLRDGQFRTHRAPFRMEIGNEGWNWANGDPYTTVNQLITPGQNVVPGLAPPVNGGMFGASLKAQVNAIITRQFRFGSLVEQMPLSTNRIVPSKQYTDNLGIPRPEITYDLDEYTKAGFKAARDAAVTIFKKMGATDFTKVNKNSPSLFTFGGEDFILNGAGHVMGTYRMGDDPNTSVVDKNLCSHDHANLYMLGSGVFPSVGTANPTLTIAALTLRAAEAILSKLNG